MSTTWRGALQRVTTALARRHKSAEGEDPELSDEAGFTLIELMVVLVIMGILMAIAIPTFLGVTSTANDTSTQSNLTNVITSAKAVYARTDAYPTTAKMVTALQADEPEFTFTSTLSTTQNTIAIATSVTPTKFLAVAYMTKTNECWAAEDVASGTSVGVKYGYVKPGATNTVTKTTCTTLKASSVTNWTTKWPSAPTGH